MHEHIPVTIADVRRETENAILVTFDISQAHQRAFAFEPGQHVSLRTVLEGGEVRRCYSICSAEGDALRIAIKRLPRGYFSVWAQDHLRAGMTIELMPPQGRFVLAPSGGRPRHVLGLAAGAGITPIIAMASHALAHEPETRFTLIYGNRTPDEIMFRSALEDLKDRYVDRLTLVHVLSRGFAEDGAMLEGRITAERLRQLAGRLLPLDEVAHAYLCGPNTMIKDLRAALLDLGMTRDRVHHEFFAPGGGAYRQGARPAAPGLDIAESQPTARLDQRSGRADIEAILDGARHRFAAAAGETVADAALRAGVRVPYSCKGGMCCTCRAKVVEGSAVMRTNYSLEAWEQAKGFVLTCQALATSDRLVVDYDQM